MDAATALTVHPKVAAATFAGSISVGIIYGLSYVITIPPEVASALTVVISGVAGYFAPWVTSHQPK